MQPRDACLFLIFLLLAVSCGNEDRQQDARSVFNYNEMNGISSLDPAAAANFENIWAVNQLFNGLVQMDDSLNVVPAIAHTYSISGDGLQYTFYLRTDVYFHDNLCFPGGHGRKVKADDFVFSFNRLLDSRLSSAASLLDKVDRTEKTRGQAFESVNDSVFRIHLESPFGAFMNILTMKYFSVIPAEAVDYYRNDFRRKPVGSGPFVFKSWDEGNKLILLKNPEYFEHDSNGRRLPYLDAVTVSFIRDRETAFMEFLNGRFDMLSGADAFNTNEVLDKEGRLRELYEKKFYLQKEAYLKTDYIGILIDENLPIVKNSPLRLKEIRLALNHGFDRKKLIKYLRNNIGIPAINGFIPEGMAGYDPGSRGYNYDPALVQQLLEKAGFPGGRGLPEMTLHVSDNYKEQVEFIQSQLARNNIKVQISIEKATVLREAVNRNEYMLFKKSWIADYPDEENFLSLFYSRNFSPKGVNYFHYANKRFDSLYEKSLTETDGKEKIRLYQEMNRLVMADAPVIPLYYDEVIRLVSRKISNLGTNPMNLLHLKTTMKGKS